MKRVLVPRAANQSQEFCDALVRNGLEPICVPLIEISATDDWSPCDNAFRNIESYDALIFTSANAVIYFIGRMAHNDRNCDEIPAGFGLGHATKKAMEQFGVTVVPTPDSMDATDLASEICTSMTKAGFDGITAMRFLFPCGNNARPELPRALRDHGAIVDEVVVYKNQPASKESTVELVSLFSAHAISCIAFFSPSQVEALVALVPNFKTDFRSAIKIAAIGNTTSDALRRAGVAADVVASNPDAEIFAEEIAKAV